MKRYYRLVVIVLVLAISQYPFSSVSAKAEPLQVIGLVASPTHPYNKPLTTYVTVMHGSGANVTACIFYQLLLNRTIALGGWRVSNARLKIALSSHNYAVFEAAIPSPLYNETLRYDMKIVYYAEARDREGNIALSTDPSDRWDPFAQGNKMVTIVTDPYPPTMSDITLSPANPTQNDGVTVTARVDDSSSGIRRVVLSYSTDDGPTFTVEMAKTSLADLYAGIIPPQQKARTVSYYLIATNNVGSSTRSARATYTISPSAQETRTERMLYFALIALAAGLTAAGLAVFIRNRLRRRTPSEEILLTKPKNPKMLAFTMLANLIGVAWFSYNTWSLSSQSNRWFSLGILTLFLLFVCGVDPRLHYFIPGPPALKSWVSRHFDEHPPLVFTAAALLLFVTSTLVATLGYFLNLLIFRGLLALTIDTLAVGTNAVFLFGAGMGLELLWSMFRKGILEVSLEKEAPGLEAEGSTHED